MRKILLGVICALTFLLPQVGWTQSAGTNLPPALQAAVMTGNPNAISQAISALSGGNPLRAASLAHAVTTAAEQMVATNPQAAISAVQAAVAVVNSQPVLSSAPQDALLVAVSASRIIVNPAVQQAAPQSVGTLAVQLSQLAATPSVYQANPNAAISIMANAYAAVSSPTVAAASTGAAQQVVSVLTTASTDPVLVAVSPSVAAQINTILADQSSPTNNDESNNQLEPLFQQPTVEPVSIPEPNSGGGNSASPS
ncbi:hypothetical protein GCM10011352_43060 [Marinobacterium zhoushanense]|uniref:Uncharacterized protein n=1 Tax=Marinobacterium zhoushanense TaxID=1679163 RepID=A0ABQ1KYJ6_9GAMM|nr:hypothetical protein [Marinobacterium zhoushanense]GGC11988.1 hypothetical protein GCM10011352_43060 [Marinobacterium zhoushanense]